MFVICYGQISQDGLIAYTMDADMDLISSFNIAVAVPSLPRACLAVTLHLPSSPPHRSHPPHPSL